MPYLRGIIAELGFDYTAIPYEQQKRKAGKSKNNFYSLYDYAMIGITSYSKVVLRMATFLGFFVGGGSVVAGIIYFILNGTVTHRNVLSGSNAAVFHRSVGRICAEH